MQITNCRTAIVNASTIGDNTIIAAPPSGVNPGKTQDVGGLQVGDITVWQVLLGGSGANVLTFKSADNVLYGPIEFTGDGSAATLQATGVPWFKCRAGESLVLALTTTATVSGSIYYTMG